MTDLAEPRALEPPIVIANRLHSRAAVYTEEGRHNAWGQLMLDGEATILSLIAEVERLRGERTVEIGAALSHWNLAAEKIKQDRQAAFRRGIEAAAKVAEGWETISAGSEYMTNGNGRYWDAGTPYDQSRQDAAAAIRAIGERVGP